MRKFKSMLALLIVLSFSGSLFAQISIAPSFVFIDENSGVGNVFVSNNSEKSYEVTVNFTFGYPGSDSDGNLIMNYTDSKAFETYALDPMVRSFPKSFILQAKEQRTVRIQVLPESRRKEGFFFTRMKVMAKPQTTDVMDTTKQEIGAKINFNFEQITAVFYHKGKVTTGLVVKDVDLRQKNGNLEVRPHLQRSGTAPFLGSMFAKLKDKQGKIVAESQSSMTVYFDEVRHLDVKLDNVTPGTYTLELSFETHRNDMLDTDLIQAPKVVQSKVVVIK